MSDDGRAAWNERDIEAAIDGVARRVLTALAAETPVGPTALQLLLRRLAATEDPDYARALGHALASAMAVPVEHVENCPGWVTVYAEASTISDDARLPVAAGSLVSRLRRAWAKETDLDRLATSVEACLGAAECLSLARLEASEGLVPDAVQELERAVGATYRPGAGVAHRIDRSHDERGGLSDQIAAASALLAGYAQTGRLPYAMLAEELLQLARRTLWDEAQGGLFADPTGRADADKPFALNCAAARVFCRLAVLHRDEGYRAAAVVAADADYADDARRTLMSVASRVDSLGIGAAVYAVALTEWLALPI